MSDDAESPPHDYMSGTSAPWYEGWEISEERREVFRATSTRSRDAKQRAIRGEAAELHAVNRPKLDPRLLMPALESHGLRALSLFSGGGGLDLGFDHAGFEHVASYDTLEASGRTLRLNRPAWTVHSGVDGDVRTVNWRAYGGEVEVVHGGPPCQPFSSAGRQRGHEDPRNLVPEFVAAVQRIRPRAFVAENVPALAGPKFAEYLERAFYTPLEHDYHVTTFRLSAHDFGVPQLRHRVIFVGFRNQRDLARFKPPVATHRADGLNGGPPAKRSDATPTMGLREALGLADIGIDALAPTLRSTLTGPRHTTSILSSVSAQRKWQALGIWPNGVAATREAASAFPSANGHFRLSVADCALLQGFPASWTFDGAVYMALGQIGNSVAPPMGYQLGVAVGQALHGRSWTPQRR